MQVADKVKKCRICQTDFKPERPLQRVCSCKCAVAVVREKNAKEQRKVNRQRKKELKTKSELLKEAQTEFNKYIRMRDSAECLPCISCQRHHTGQYHAGHYRSVGATKNSTLRFNEDNCHLQCSACNNFKSGNAIDYRINLINKIGIDRVMMLEGPQEPVKWDREDITMIKKTYRAKWKQLQNDLDAS